MIKIITVIMALIGILSTATAQTAAKSDKKVLVVYYTRSGNTHHIVSEIGKIIPTTEYEIVLTNPYPAEYNACGEQAKRDLDQQARPEIKNPLPDVAEYDVILVGYPIWCGSFPMPIPSFLEKCDLKGKTVIPFCTHGGGGSYNSFSDIRKSCPNATIGTGLALYGKGGGALTNELHRWLSENKLIDK